MKSSVNIDKHIIQKLERLNIEHDTIIFIIPILRKAICNTKDKFNKDFFRASLRAYKERKLQIVKLIKENNRKLKTKSNTKE